MKVGRGKANIQIPIDILPLENFTTIYDLPQIRLLIVEQNEITFLMVSVDATSLKEEIVEEIKQFLSEKAAVPSQYIWVAATHSFSIPHISNPSSTMSAEKREKNERLLAILLEALEKSLEIAIEQKEEAEIYFGSTSCSVACNRDIETKQGWWIGYNPNENRQQLISGFYFKNKSGEIIAACLQAPVPSSVLQDVGLNEGKIISSDLFGKVSQALEEKYRSSVCLMTIGAAADQMPLLKGRCLMKSISNELFEMDFGLASFHFLDLLAERLFQAIDRIFEQGNLLENPDLQFGIKSLICAGQQLPKMTDLQPRKNYHYQQDKNQTLTIETLQIGSLLLIGLQPEVPFQLLEELAAISTLPFMVMTMINGGAKYMVDERAYQEYHYEAMNSMYAKGSYEKLLEELKELVRKRRDWV